MDTRNGQIYDQSIIENLTEKEKSFFVPITDDEYEQVKDEDSELRVKKILKNRNRNLPCPCRSGKKFKKCCILKFK